MKQAEAFEKQAFLAALLKQLAGRGILPGLKGMLGSAGRAAKSTAINAAKKSAVPAIAAGTGAGGYALGNTHGFAAGDSVGYGRGSAEGGVNATRNLFKGLMDLQQQGAKSKSSLKTLMPKQGSAKNPDFNMTHTERRLLRIKVAQHVLNMDALKNEMDRYNLPVLQKAASAGVNKKQRIKYAALVRQYELEKQAFIGGLARLAGKGLLSGAKMLGRGAMAGGRAGMAGARAAAPHVGRAIQTGAQAAGRGAMNAGKGIANMAGGAVRGGVNAARKAYAPASSVGEGIGGSIKSYVTAGAQAARANKLGKGMLAGGPSSRTAQTFAQRLAGATPSSYRQQAVTQLGRTVGDTMRAGLQGMGQGIAQAARANPMQALMGTGAMGIGLGSQLPGMYNNLRGGMRRMGRAGHNMLTDGARELTGVVSQGQEGLNSAYEDVGNFMNTIGQAGQDIYGGFQQAGNRFQ